jgi:hypothetical protein
MPDRLAVNKNQSAPVAETASKKEDYTPGIRSADIKK